MEKRFNVSESTETAIKEMSEELLNLGICGAEFYYSDDNMPMPYFKIEKAYKKEKETDPDNHTLFIDVDLRDKYPEFTVVGLLCHEHFDSPLFAAELIKGLVEETVAEVALVYPNAKATFFIANTGDPAKNVKRIDENAKTIIERLFSSTQGVGYHIHSLFSVSLTNNLLCDHNEQLKINGVNVYLVSAVAGYHPEYYVIQ